MMNFKGMILDVGIDYKSGKRKITLSMDSDDCLVELQDLQDRTVDVQIKRATHARSMKANAYTWVLLQNLAEKLQTSKEDVYLLELVKYSSLFTTIWISSDAINDFVKRWRTVEDLGERYRYETRNGKKKRIKGHDFNVYLGMSAFDNEDMRVFIDGVVRDCNEMGISTIPPEDIERMKRQWGMTTTRS